MKHYLATSAALALISGAASAGGLDRTGQPMGLIFEDGNYVEFSMGHANPTLTGQDLAPFTTSFTGNVGQSFNQVAAGFRYEFSDQLSFSLIYDQPWGSDISYAAGGSTYLGGTQAFASSDAITGILRYKFDDTFSVHGGLRYQQVDGNITLSGLAYGALNGYNVDLDRDAAVGWLAGGAYEIPEIALRLAITYQSEIEHSFDTVESIAPSVTSQSIVKTPQSVNIDFQTGIAPDTLLLAGIRWADHSETKLKPSAAGVDLIDITDSTTYTLGIARRFNENLVGSISLGYEAEQDDNLVSPLAPTNGFQSISLGLQYSRDNYKISGGVRYTMLGDAFAETGTPDVARSSFTGNDAISFGVKVGFYF